MKSKPQCSTKLCKLQILWNKSTHHERPMYVEVSTNLIKCILNGAAFCCSSFIERENAQRLLKTRGRPLVDGCNWGDGIEESKHTETQRFPYLWVLYRQNQIKALDKMTSSTSPDPHLCLLYGKEKTGDMKESESLLITLCSSTPQLLWDVDKCSASWPGGIWREKQTPFD